LDTYQFKEQKKSQSLLARIYVAKQINLRIRQLERKAEECEQEEQSHCRKNVGESIFLDSSSVKEKAEVEDPVDSTKSMYWRIMVDKATQYKMTDFH
jgi:hypothetical protein